jgi:streptogramin lyase
MFDQPSQQRHSNVVPTATPSLPAARIFASAAAALGLAAVLSGCAMNSISSATASGSGGVGAAKTPQISGLVYGGQAPISGAVIQLYAVGMTGLASASTPLIPSSTPQTVGQNVTSPTGGFNISGLYNLTTCNLPGTQVYLVATGGTAVGNSSVNNDIALVSALGSCTAIANSSTPVHIQMNEVNTVAAAYALAPFASSLTSIGATFSNGTPPTGLVNAFSNANLISPYSVGYPGANAPTGVTVPVAEVDTIADILATCVNSNGGNSGDGSFCGKLFAGTGVTTNTFDAALQFAKRPGAPSIIALYNQVPGIGAPFVPTLSLTSPPNDFSVAVTYAGTAGTLATPYGIALDASGNAWVTNESGSNVAIFAPTGTLLQSFSPAADLYGAQGIAIDKTGLVWIANTAGNSVIQVNPNTQAASEFTVGGITAPTAIAIDSQNNAWVANFNGNSVTELSSAGAALNGSPLTAGGNITVPTAIAVSKSASNGAVYVTSGSGSLVKLNQATGAYLTADNDGTLQGPSAIATDPVSGYIVATGYTTGSSVGSALSEFSSDVAASASPVTSGLSGPAGVADDGASIWIVNSNTSGSLSQFTYGASSALSLASGYGSLNTPIGVAVDSSGSIWTTNSGSNTISKFIGLSTPVATPIAVNVGP